MRKQALALFAVAAVGITSVFSYTPSAALEVKLDLAVDKIESVLDLKGENYRTKFLTTIKLYQTKYSENERASYILDYIYDELIEEEDDHSNDDNEESHSHDTRVSSDYMGEYILSNSETGTKVEVTIEENSRKIVSNALPNHETGDFPTKGNPNTISAQSKIYSIPLEPEYTGNAKWAREPGVGINGVKFEPETAERVECESGETYKIEAIQDFANLGLDTQNAHVQPTGEYHYHGIAEGLVDSADSGEDLVHVGFAKDGHMMYYSKSGEYAPSYTLSTETRDGTSCSYRNSNIPVDGTSPDGTYVSDWKYVAGKGELDVCNGIEINGEYMYLVTDEYPYVPRCLMGEFSESKPSGGGGAGRGGRMGPPPRR